MLISVSRFSHFILCQFNGVTALCFIQPHSNQPGCDGSIAEAEEANLQMNIFLLQMLLHCQAPCSPSHGVMSVFFSHLHCRTSTMAQVPKLVTKPLFTAIQLPFSTRKKPF